MFTLPTSGMGAFNVPSFPVSMPKFDAFGRNVSVLDDAKSKAKGELRKQGQYLDAYVAIMLG